MNNEIWKPVLGYEGLYEVSNFGRVKSLSKNVHYKNRVCKTKDKILKQSKSSNGYPLVHLYFSGKKRKTVTTHRLVAQAFLKITLEKPHVNHISGVKTENNVNNLEMVTPSENMQHAKATGLWKPSLGEATSGAKLNNFDVLYIRDFYRRKVLDQKGLAGLFNIDKSAISRIITYKNWSHLP